MHPSDPNFYKQESRSTASNSYYGKKTRHSSKIENEDLRYTSNAQVSTHASQKSTKYFFNTNEQEQYNYSKKRAENFANKSRFQVSGQMRSGHVELDSLYGGNSGLVQVNAMNAPNDSTVQCGCENIDCPFCNLMKSVEMKQ